MPGRSRKRRRCSTSTPSSTLASRSATISRVRAAASRPLQEPVEPGAQGTTARWSRSPPRLRHAIEPGTAARSAPPRRSGRRPRARPAGPARTPSHRGRRAASGSWRAPSASPLQLADRRGGGVEDVLAVVGDHQRGLVVALPPAPRTRRSPAAPRSCPVRVRRVGLARSTTRTPSGTSGATASGSRASVVLPFRPPHLLAMAVQTRIQVRQLASRPTAKDPAPRCARPRNDPTKARSRREPESHGCRVEIPTRGTERLRKTPPSTGCPSRPGAGNARGPRPAWRSASKSGTPAPAANGPARCSTDAATGVARCPGRGLPGRCRGRRRAAGDGARHLLRRPRPCRRRPQARRHPFAHPARRPPPWSPNTTSLADLVADLRDLWAVPIFPTTTGSSSS